MKSLVCTLVLLLSSQISITQIAESDSIDAIFSQWNNTTPGASLGIIKDAKLVYAKGYGLANLEYDIPNSPTSVFRIGSTSKQFTAACIVLLEQQGKLIFDNTLKSYFPDFPEYAKKITVRHLLNHTSGIRDYLQLTYLKGFSDDDFYTDATLMKMLLAQTDLNFEPGEEFTYSNSGYWLLGQIVEKASGMNMADYAAQEIFKPLGMTNTHFHNNHTQIVKNRASGYVPKRDGGFRISMTTLDMIGDGGIFTSIEDIKKWDDAYYNSTVLNREFWNIMTTNGKLNNGEKIDYAAGLFVEDYKGINHINHGGAFVGFRAELLRFPEQKLSIAIFANRGDANPSRMAYQIADILLKDDLKEEEAETEEIAPQPKSKVSVIALPQMEGTYEIEAGLSFTVKATSTGLDVTQNWNKSNYIIERTQGNTFVIPNQENLDFTFSTLENNETQTITIVQNGNVSTATRVIPFDMSTITLSDYVGNFYSKELDVTYHTSIKDEILLIAIADQEPVEATVTTMDQFSTQLGLVRFMRFNDRISGFELDSGRVVKLKFNRK